MKDMTTFKIGEKQYELYFNIGDMRAIEREIGYSIISILSGDWRYLISRITTDILVAGVRYGIHDGKYGERTDDEVYDLLQGYCNDGHNLDEFTALFIEALFRTGLYNPVQVKSKNAKTEKTKAVRQSAPSKTGSVSPNR